MQTAAVGRIMVPNVVHILTPRTSQYFTFLGKRDLIDVVKGMDLEIGRSSCIIQVGPV